MDPDFKRVLPVSAACCEGDLEALTSLLETEPSDHVARGIWCWKPTNMSFNEKKEFETVFDFKVFEEGKRNIIAKSHFFKTALYLACENGHEDCALAIIEHCPESLRHGMLFNGCRYNIMNDIGFGMLVGYCYSECPDLQASDAYSLAPIHVACEKGLKRVVVKMLDLDKSLATQYRVWWDTANADMTESPLMLAALAYCESDGESQDLRDIIVMLLDAMESSDRDAHCREARSTLKLCETTMYNASLFDDVVGGSSPSSSKRRKV